MQRELVDHQEHRVWSHVSLASARSCGPPQRVGSAKAHAAAPCRECGGTVGGTQSRGSFATARMRWLPTSATSSWHASGLQKTSQTSSEKRADVGAPSMNPGTPHCPASVSTKPAAEACHEP